MAIRSNILMTALVPMLVLLLSVLSPIIAGPIPENQLRAVDSAPFPVMARYYKHHYPNATSTNPPYPTGTS